MPNFNTFAAQIKQQFNIMSEHPLFVVGISKDEAWEHYMSSFPAGTNEIYRERREYDCNSCKQFIRKAANVVAIIDNQLVSIWDVVAEDYYADVTTSMSAYIKSKPIVSIFLHNERHIGKATTAELLPDNGVKQWSHFHVTIPTRFFEKDLATKIGKANTNRQLFERGLKELTVGSIETVEELILQGSLYRGEEHKSKIQQFLALKNEYDALESDEQKTFYTWLNYKHPAALIRNAVIGTLLQDLSEGKDLEDAVKSFEAKVAPSNYKRSSKIVTKGMMDKAIKQIDELGLRPALQRRFATSEDLTVNNVLFVDRSTILADKDPLMALVDDAPIKQDFSKVEEISIEDFMTNVVPKVTSIEALVENSHTSNFASIIAPADPDAPSLLKWNSPFSWTYNGDVTDSMKEKVKAAGGNIEGVLRFSIQWNEDGYDGSNDLDAHCNEPRGHIYYGNIEISSTGGNLDVDITDPRSQTESGTAVENITWPELSRMIDGTYQFYVHNFSGRNSGGFRAQIEFDGQIFEYDYPKSVTSDVTVAVVTLKNGQFIIDHKLEPSTSSKEVWGISTKQFHKVSTMILSPNYWDGDATGNKHYFFLLDGCVNPDKARGIYSEFLRNDLHDHRKTFELLGNKMRCEHSDNQLSGLGFSSTQRNELIVKVSGTFNRMLKIKF